MGRLGEMDGCVRACVRVYFRGEDGGWMDGLEYVKREDGGGWFGRVLKAVFVVCVRWRITVVIC